MRNKVSSLLALLALLCCASPVLAQTAVSPDLGAAAPFTVVGTTAVTCVGPGTISGDVGSGGALTPGTCTISGTSTTPVAATVTTAIATARASIDSQNPTCTATIPTTSQTLAPGVYCSVAGTTIGAGVVLTLSGNASDVWVFRVGTGGTGALTLNSAQVVMGGTALGCNVYWRTAEAATLTSATFNGTILAGTSVTMTDGSWNGRALATSAASLTRPASMTFAGCSAPSTITVRKDFVPNSTATVPVALTCTSGTITTAPTTISEATAAVFRVGGAALSGATCTATETVPTGYTATQTACAGVALNGSCTITNTLDDTSSPEPPAGTLPDTPPAGCPVIGLAPTTIPNGNVGVAYSQQFTGSGGTSPYFFTTTNATLPAGITLRAGLLAGTPTSATPQTFTIRVTDANSCFTSRVYTMRFADDVGPAPTPPAGCPAIGLAPATLSNGSVGVAYSQQFEGTGGTAPYQYRTDAAALPAGLSLSIAGLLTGTPTSAATQTFTVRVNDALGCFTDRIYTLRFGVAVPTMPQYMFVLLALALMVVGYRRLRPARQSR